MTASRSSGRQLLQRVLDANAKLNLGYLVHLAGAGVGKAVCHGGAVAVIADCLVQRVRGAIQAGAAKVIDQQVARQRGKPRGKRALFRIEAAQVAIHLQKDVLGKILRVCGRAGEAIADAVDPAMLRRHQLLPRCGFAAHAGEHDLVQCLNFRCFGRIHHGGLCRTGMPALLLAGRFFRRTRQVPLLLQWQQCTATVTRHRQIRRSKTHGRQQSRMFLQAHGRGDLHGQAGPFP